MSKVRVNFYLKNRAVKEALDCFIERSGRSQADVIRQLVTEVVDAERGPGSLPAPRVRTNCLIDLGLLAKFRECLKALGAPEDIDARDVLTELVSEFLEEKDAVNQRDQEK